MLWKAAYGHWSHQSAVFAPATKGTAHNLHTDFKKYSVRPGASASDAIHIEYVWLLHGIRTSEGGGWGQGRRAAVE